MSWTNPKTWVLNEALTASDLNTYVRDNFSYLLNRPADIFTGSASDRTLVTITSTTPVAVNNVNTLSINIASTRVEIWVFARVAIDATRLGRLDVFVDNSYYVSSLTSTALTNGLWADRAISANGPKASFKVILDGLTPGTHTFQLRAWVNAGQIIIAIANLQFGVKEV